MLWPGAAGSDVADSSSRTDGIQAAGTTKPEVATVISYHAHDGYGHVMVLKVFAIVLVDTIFGSAYPDIIVRITKELIDISLT